MTLQMFKIKVIFFKISLYGVLVLLNYFDERRPSCHLPGMVLIVVNRYLHLYHSPVRLYTDSIFTNSLFNMLGTF